MKSSSSPWRKTSLEAGSIDERRGDGAFTRIGLGAAVQNPSSRWNFQRMQIGSLRAVRGERRHWKPEVLTSAAATALSHASDLAPRSKPLQAAGTFNGCVRIVSGNATRALPNAAW